MQSCNDCSADVFGVCMWPGLATGLVKAVPRPNLVEVVPDLIWLRLSQTAIVPELSEVYLEINN